MKRSQINEAFAQASSCFTRHHWALPPAPRWDITDFGLGDFDNFGLVLINLAEEPEYCEKLMYGRRNQVTPAHTHRIKKEDIICRSGRLGLRLWPGIPADCAEGEAFTVPVNGDLREAKVGELLELAPGERITLVPGIYHEFFSVAEESIIGEVSTANDDATDNIFVNPDIGRFPGIEEDEPAQVRLLSESD